MRALLDESLPVELVAELPGFDITTVRAQGWLRLRNGVLLRAAVAHGEGWRCDRGHAVTLRPGWKPA